MLLFQEHYRASVVAGPNGQIYQTCKFRQLQNGCRAKYLIQWCSTTFGQQSIIAGWPNWGFSNLSRRLFELCENLNICFLYLLQSVEIL